MKTEYYTAATLDGFIATEDDSLEWLFPLGDIGAGKPLLPRSITSPPLRLTAARMFGPGFAELRYDLPASTSDPRREGR